MLWEPEHCIGAPAGILLLSDDVGDGAADINSCHTLSQPLTLHVCGGDTPDLHNNSNNV
jgi:hypothetical protein